MWPFGDGEFRMIVDASTGHDPTKSEVDHWLAGDEPNQAPIGSLENPFKQIQTCVNVQHQLRGCLLWSWLTGGRFADLPMMMATVLADMDARVIRWLATKSSHLCCADWNIPGTCECE